MCAAGFGARQVWATTRSRLSVINKSSVVDQYFEPIPMGLVPEDALDPEDEELESLGWPSRARRMLRLAAPPLRGVASSLADGPVTLFLGLPELTTTPSAWLESFSKRLCARAGLTLDEASSHIFPQGRASALIALENALTVLGNGLTRCVLVGGVDTFFDLRLLATLGAEGRVLGPRVMDGFVPGEGAGFLLLKGIQASESCTTVIQGAASVIDPGFRSGTEPALGEGLAEALHLLRGRLSSPAQPIGSTFAGFNGENFEAKLWGVAQLRHRDFFAPGMILEHPASCYGDTGAATGAILTAVATAALSVHHRPGPALVWAASDSKERACTVLATRPS